MAQSRFTCVPLWRLQKMKCATGRDFWANGAPYDLIKNPASSEPMNISTLKILPADIKSYKDQK